MHTSLERGVFSRTGRIALNPVSHGFELVAEDEDTWSTSNLGLPDPDGRATERSSTLGASVREDVAVSGRMTGDPGIQIILGGRGECRHLDR